MLGWLLVSRVGFLSFAGVRGKGEGDEGEGWGSEDQSYIVHIIASLNQLSILLTTLQVACHLCGSLFSSELSADGPPALRDTALGQFSQYRPHMS